MKKKSKYLSIFTLFLIIFSFPSFSMDKSNFENGLAIGDKIPNFSIKTEKNKIVDSNKDIKGKVSLIAITNYCTHALAGIWIIPSYYKHHNNKNFSLAFIFNRHCVPFYVPNSFIISQSAYSANSTKIPYYLLDLDYKVTKLFRGSHEYAHIYVTDTDGIIRYKETLITPFTSTNEMNLIIQSLLDKINSSN